MVLSGDPGLTEITFYAICMEGTCVGSSWLANLVLITRRSLTMLADVDNIVHLIDRRCASLVWSRHVQFPTLVRLSLVSISSESRLKTVAH